MLMMQAAVCLFHQAMLPVVGGAFAGLSLALLRLPVRLFGLHESESLMNFSSLGMLRCICAESHMEERGQERGRSALRAAVRWSRQMRRS